MDCRFGLVFGFVTVVGVGVLLCLLGVSASWGWCNRFVILVVGLGMIRGLFVLGW